jgi:RNA polymerase sigma-70 factor (ECF subfamily)
MLPRSEPSKVEKQLLQAQNGSPEVLGQILEAYRAYLIVIAGEELPPQLRGKVGASDLVQEAFFEAHRDFAMFRGRTEEELLAWLRRILLNNIANVSRQYLGTEKRQVAREIPLDASSRVDVKEGLPTDMPSPSALAQQKEQLESVQLALEALPVPFREVIQWRNLELQAFAEIAQRMNRTEKAVQKLWSRAIRELRNRLVRPS